MRLPTVEELEATVERLRIAPEIIQAALQRIHPSWSLVERIPDGGAVFRRGTIQVLWSVTRESDGHAWIHVSLCGRQGRERFYLPFYEDVLRVKHDFLGERWAYQVFPDEAHYVNQHPCVLHLYARLEGEAVLPDFTHGLGAI